MSFIEKCARTIDQETLKRILDNPLCNETCEVMHGGHCNMRAAIQFIHGARGVFKMYLVVHLAPLLLFKLKKVKKNPKEQLLKFIMGLTSSLVFGGLSCAVIRRVICLLTKCFSNNFTIAPYPVSVAGLALLFELPSRQAEITLYSVSKAWEAAYGMLLRLSYPARIPCGNLWINGISLAAISFVFLSDRSVFREGYRGVLNMILNDV